MSNILGTINDLNETSSFISRHIGSSDDQVKDCLDFLNYESLDPVSYTHLTLPTSDLV